MHCALKSNRSFLILTSHTWTCIRGGAGWRLSYRDFAHQPPFRGARISAQWIKRCYLSQEPIISFMRHWGYELRIFTVLSLRWLTQKWSKPHSLKTTKIGEKYSQGFGLIAFSASIRLVFCCRKLSRSGTNLSRGGVYWFYILTYIYSMWYLKTLMSFKRPSYRLSNSVRTSTRQ